MFKLIKFVSFLAIILLSIGNYFSPAVVAQNLTEPVLIPLENLEFTPKRSDLNDPGKVDIQIKLGDFLPIGDNSTCKFTFNQTNQAGEVVQTAENFVETTYLNRSCVGVLSKEKQIAKNITLSLVVTTPDNQKFGSYLSFIIGQNTENLIIDPNEYSLPPELATKPEINIIIKRKELFVGDKTQLQVEISNRDNFALKDFVLKTSIPDKIGKIDCQSFNFTENKLDGQLIFNPNFLPSINVYANEQDTASCITDEYNFQLILASLEPNKTTRLNFELNMEKPGDLKFDFTTNLDQKGISKQTSVIAVIKPKATDSNTFPIWVIVVAVIVAILTIGGSVYWWLRQKARKNASRLDIKI